MSTAPKGLQPWLRVDAFEAIQKPGSSDWPHGNGQTFDKYVATSRQLKSLPRRSAGSGRHKIYLLPLSDSQEDQPPISILNALAEGCTAFYDLACEVLQMTSLEQLEGPSPGRPIKKRGLQVNASDVIHHVKKQLPCDGFTICAVTKLDLYAGEYNFLYGLAGLQGGVFSLARLQSGTTYPDDSDPVLLRRAFGVLTHELTHTFGLTHCIYFSCLMQGFNSLDELETHVPDLCPVCLRKLLWICNAEDQAAQRYDRLLRWYHGRPSFEQHAAFVQHRLQLAGSNKHNKTTTRLGGHGASQRTQARAGRSRPWAEDAGKAVCAPCE